jgi:hypothetical protein
MPKKTTHDDTPTEYDIMRAIETKIEYRGFLACEVCGESHRVVRTESFADAGMLTRDTGFVVELDVAGKRVRYAITVQEIGR